ncbi:CPSF A subunit region-domain-containing protein [Pisolithus marmoratus]|nr:CPSF A subunit region-domain-containing protein [Pisolithus marmoratus]
MKVVATYHPPSSVLDSAKCTLADDDGSEFLFVAKLDRVDVYAIRPDGLHHQTGIEVWGRVRAVRPVPTQYRVISALVLTDHPEPELLFLSLTQSGTVLTVTKRLSLFERSSRPAEFFHDVVVSPFGKYAVASVYTARLRIILLDAEGQYDRDFDASTMELNLLSIAFVAPDTLALLHIDCQQRFQLLARDIGSGDFQLSPAASLLLPPFALPDDWFSVEEHPPRLVLVPPDEEKDQNFNGAILVIGGRKILLYDLASNDAAARNRSKAQRMDKMKRSADAEEASRAKQKEKERERFKKKPRATVDWPWSDVAASCTLDESHTKFLIGDKYGRLAMLHVDITGGFSLTLIALGEASSPTCLTYLANQVVYLGSHYGDSQLLRISQTPVSSLDTPTLSVPSSVPTIRPAQLGAPGKRRATDAAEGLVVNGLGSYLVELERFTNLAPIVDAVLVDIDNTGQKETVTCSGGRNTGSLRSVRRGADFKEAAIIKGVAGVTRVWTLRRRYNDSEHTHLVVSVLNRTHLFRFDETRGSVVSSLPETSSGFETSTRTIAVANVMRLTRKDSSLIYDEDSSLVVQVVPKGLVLLEYNMEAGEFTRKSELPLDKLKDRNILPQALSGQAIVAADINASQIILALEYRWMIQLAVMDGQFISQRSRQYSDEISAVSCVPLSGKGFAKHTTYIAASFWKSDHVKIVKLLSQREAVGLPSDGLIADVCRSEQLPAAPRSLLLHSFTSDEDDKQTYPHLLVGLVDGTVVSFAYRDNALVDMKLISVGVLPVSLHVTVVNSQSAVMACSNRASVLGWEKGRLLYSPLMIKDVNAAAYLNTWEHPASVILAGAESLVIGAVTSFDKVHIRSVPLGYDAPRCIVHCPPWKAFAVACLRMTPARVSEAEAEMFSSSVQLFNETTFEKIAQLNVKNSEDVTALHFLTVTLAGQAINFVCAGVTVYDHYEHEPSQGRIILLQKTTGHNLSATQALTVTITADVKGCIYALTSVGDTIVAAVNSSLILLRVEYANKSISLRKVAAWNHNYLITTLVSRGDLLLVGDALTSVSLVKLNESEVELIAKDFGSLWPTCAQLLDEKSLIGANSDYNLFAFRLQKTELQKSLEREGHYFVGDIINKFVPGSLGLYEVSADVPMQPQQLFFTPTGKIGVVINMDKELSLHMTSLQRNLSTYFERKEGVSHSRFRAPKNSRGRSDSEASSFGFLDGDFLERFLLLVENPRALRQVMNGQSEPERLTISSERIQKVLERLQRMH